VTYSVEGNASAYVWDMGDGTVVTGGNTITHRWSLGGSYQVSVGVAGYWNWNRGAKKRRSVFVSEYFTQRNSQTAARLNAVATNGFQVVAVGETGTIRTSTDGVNWVARALPVSSDTVGLVSMSADLTGTDLSLPQGSRKILELSDITWDGSRFIAVGYGGDFGALPSDNNSVSVGFRSMFGVIYTSVDGETWVQRYRGERVLTSVASNGAVTLAVGLGTILRSTDGGSWTESPQPDVPITGYVSYGGVTFGNGVFALTGSVYAESASLFTSPDGVTWTDRSLAARLEVVPFYNRVTFLNGRLVVSGANAGTDASGKPTHSLFAVSSDNGQTFSFTPPVQRASNYQPLSTGLVVFENGVEIAVKCSDLVFFKDTFLTVDADGAIAQSAIFDGRAPAQITQQPVPTTVATGGNTTLSVKAKGKGPFTYQWFKDGVRLEKGTLPSYWVVNATAGDAGDYTVSVRNSAGEVVSDAAKLTVVAPPAFVSQPRGALLRAGNRLELIANVSGTETLTYQWRRNGTKINGATRRTFEMADVRTSDSATYDVVVTNSAGSVTSVGAVIRVNASAEEGAEVPPVIVRQPVSKVVRSREVVELSVSALAADGGTLSYQWFKDGAAIPQATAATYSWYASANGQNAGLYSVTVSAGGVGVASDVVAVVVVPQTYTSSLATHAYAFDGGKSWESLMRITAHPSGGSFLARSKVTLSVTTEGGVAPLTYQWMLNDVPVRGGRSPKLVLSGAKSSQAGVYTVAVTDATGLCLLSYGASIQIQDPAPVEGTYQGLISAGRVTVTVNPMGSYSGRLDYAGSVYPMSGVLESVGFDGASGFRKTLPPGENGESMSINLTFREAQRSSIEVFRTKGSTLEVESARLWKFVFHTTKNKPVQTGRYSVLIGTENRYVAQKATGPDGLLGPGSFVVSAGGIVTASGRLPDTTPYSMSAMLSEVGGFAWYNRLYASSGAKAGWLKGWIPADNTDSDGSASLQWVKPARTSGFFAEGFAKILTMAVSPYSLPKVGRVLRESNGVLNFTFTRADGSFLTKEFSLSPTHILAVTGENPEQLNLQLNRQTGLVSGSLVDPFSGQTLKLEGVTLQTQVGEISGLGFGGTQLGTFTLTP
jgi:hypothetical protein